MSKKLLRTFLLALLVVTASSWAWRTAGPPVQLLENQPAPSFTANDVLGNPVSLERLRGHRVLLSFMRDAGCPICELRLHRLSLRADSLRAANTRVVLVYESDAATMRQYLVDKDLPFTFIADPDGALHDQFGVETSIGKTALGFVKGAGKKIREGKKLQTQQIARDDATLTRITADFIIDEELIVRRAYYGKYLGDHLPL